MSVKVVGLTGFKQCGKSTLAKAIVTEATKRGRHGCVYSFAKPLKEICHILFGGHEANWYGDMKTEILPEWSLLLGPDYATPRRIMQTMGTEVFRTRVHQQFWLMVAERYIRDMVRQQQCDFIVIDDVRFDNEAEFVVDMFMGVVVRVQRACPLPEHDGHASERGVRSQLIDFTYTCADVDAINGAAIDIVNREHV